MKSTLKKIKFSKSPKTTVPCRDKKINKEITRILASNSGTIDESLVPFARNFYSILIKEAEKDENILSDEPIQQDVKDFTPEKNKEDFTNALEPDTNENQFDVEGLPVGMTTDAINKVNEWSSKLQEFANFLNDPNNKDSLHKILADADRPNSVLRGVTRKTSDAITRVAGEIRKIEEVLNSFSIMAPKKVRDTEKLG
jgi:hypothetical protein